MNYFLRSCLFAVTILLVAVGCSDDDGCANKIDACNDSPIEDTSGDPFASTGWYYDEVTNTCYEASITEGPDGFATKESCMNYCGCN